MQKEPGYDIIYTGHIKALSLSGRRKDGKKTGDTLTNIRMLWVKCNLSMHGS